MMLHGEMVPVLGAGGGPILPPINDALAERAKRWKGVLADGDVGPLIIAEEIVRLSERWDEYAEETGGLSCSGWLRSQLGKGNGLAWFKKRNEAVLKLGRTSMRAIHHEVAVWISRICPDDKLQEVKEALMAARKGNSRRPLNLGQARPLVVAIIGRAVLRRSRTKVCERCSILEKVLREHGVEVPT